MDLSKILEAVPDIGDKYAREITIARMAFESGKKSSADSRRIDWLADEDNTIGLVLLPTECVTENVHSLRDAIDAAMNITRADA